MKTLLTFFIALLLSLALKAQNGPKGELFGEWRFIQSDKALQYRFRKEKQEGDQVHLRMQFRLNKTDEIFCIAPECQGYFWFFNFKNEYVDIDKHYFVYNTFERIVDLPETIIVKLIKNEYGEQFWDDAQKSLFYKDYSSGESSKIAIGWACVESIISGDDSNRCDNFDAKKAEILK